MAIEQARSISPNATILSPRYDRYAECAELLRSVLENFACTVDPDSHHGFYLNFFGSPLLQHDFPGTLRRLQLEILKLAGLPVSIGAGKSKIIAAIASRLERPCGLRIITRGTESAFLATLPIEALDGVSRIKSANLRKRGITTLAELRRVPFASLQSAYGDSTGRELWQNSRGLDLTNSLAPSSAKSVFREITLDAPTLTPDHLDALAKYLCSRVASALRDSQRQARSLCLCVYYADQFSASQSVQLSANTSDTCQLLSPAQSLLRTLFTRPIPIYSLAISVTTVPSTSAVESHFRIADLAATA